MNTIELVIVLCWTVGVAFASFRIGYSEGHNDATITNAKAKLGLSDTDDAKSDK